jgi:hypothetical protein
LNAKVFEITGRPRSSLIGNADISDFELKEVGQVPAVEILENIHITLYTLDLENGLAVFVETPPEVDLCYAPFYYVAQFENATRVMTISFETMIELAKSVVIDESRLVFIHSVGRSGSTLAGQIFAQVVGVVNISEPDALTIMVIERFSKPGDEETVKTLLDAVVRLLCKDPTEGVWVIKGRSFVIELADWLDELYPKSKHVFLYRAADQYVVSAKRAFVNYDGMTAEEIRKVEITTRAGVGLVVPLINLYDPRKHLSTAGILSLMWLSVMERYVKLHEQGIEMLAIPYQIWRSKPREAAIAMLEYCDCCPDDLAVLDKAIERDSQAGTFLAKDKVIKREDNVVPEDLEDLRIHLAEHAFINTADYEVSNTLKM